MNFEEWNKKLKWKKKMQNTFIFVSNLILLLYVVNNNFTNIRF